MYPCEDTDATRQNGSGPVGCDYGIEACDHQQARQRKRDNTPHKQAFVSWWVSTLILGVLIVSRMCAGQPANRPSVLVQKRHLVIQQVHRPVSNQPDQQTDNHEEWDGPAKVQAFGTLGILLVTSVYAVFAIAQWRAMVHANAINRSAVAAAERSLEVAREQSRLELRAWVAVPAIRLDSESVKDRLIVTIELANTGRTPATNLCIHTRCMLGNNTMEPDLSALENVQATGNGIIAPNQHVLASIPTRATWDKLRSRSHRFFVMGFASYEDVFRQPHRLTYCWLFDADTDAFKSYELHDGTN